MCTSFFFTLSMTMIEDLKTRTATSMVLPAEPSFQLYDVTLSFLFYYARVELLYNTPCQSTHLYAGKTGIHSMATNKQTNKIYLKSAKILEANYCKHTTNIMPGLTHSCNNQSRCDCCCMNDCILYLGTIKNTTT